MIHSCSLLDSDDAPGTVVRSVAYVWLKIAIVILFIANLAALGSAFYTLLTDKGKGGQRTARLLLLRVSLAALLLLFIVYGFWSGQLGVSAPWR